MTVKVNHQMTKQNLFHPSQIQRPWAAFSCNWSSFSIRLGNLKNADTLEHSKPNTSSKPCCLGNKGPTEEPRLNNSVRHGDVIEGEATSLWGPKHEGVHMWIRLCERMWCTVHMLVLEGRDFVV